MKSPHTIFHEESSIEGRAMDSETWTDPSEWPTQWLEVSFKSYPRLPSIPLPPFERTPVSDAIARRRSQRENTTEPIELSALASILRGAMADAESGSSSAVRRRYPSAGARFPVEAYLVALRCTGLASGVYHAGEGRGTLLAEAPPEALANAMLAAFGHGWIARARAAIVLTAVMPRTTVKYGPRGYRFALIEAGHIMQNLCLLAAEANVAFAPVGGFADQVLARLLGLEDDDELPLYAGVLP